MIHSIKPADRLGAIRGNQRPSLSVINALSPEYECHNLPINYDFQLSEEFDALAIYSRFGTERAEKLRDITAAMFEAIMEDDCIRFDDRKAVVLDVS